MIGGTIIGLARRKEYTLVHVQDHRDTCSIRIKEQKEIGNEPVEVQVGDRIWWQSGHAFYTPKHNYGKHNSGAKGGVDYDIRLPKLGYSH